MKISCWNANLVRSPKIFATDPALFLEERTNAGRFSSRHGELRQRSNGSSFKRGIGHSAGTFVCRAALASVPSPDLWRWRLILSIGRRLRAE